MLTIHGLPFSAHTRKVILAALEKRLDYTLREVMPLAPPAGFREQSPLGKIPVLEDGALTIPDSSVIALYLDRKYPQVPLYPSDPARYARALWIEEYVDGDLAPHVLHGVLLQKVFAPKFSKRAPDQALVERSLVQEIPPRLAYLESQLAGDWFAGEFGMADITVASMLLNYSYAGVELDASRHPRLVALVERVLRRDSARRAFERELPAAADVGLDLALPRKLGY